MHDITPVYFIFISIVGLAIYFLPSFLAMKKKNALSIVLLNFFLGWTLIGWVGALVWAVSHEKGETIDANTTELKSLFDLKKSGAITDAEYENEKKRILNR